MDTSLLKQFLLWLMFSGGGGMAAYFLIERVPFLVALTSRQKRYAALALSGAIPILAWLAAIGLGYHPQPATWQAWLEEAFSLFGIAFGLSQVIHAKQL